MQVNQISDKQLEAIFSFAADNGRNWKSELRHSWETCNYGGRTDGCYLQQVRNQFGPEWLVKFSLKKAIAAADQRANDAQAARLAQEEETANAIKADKAFQAKWEAAWPQHAPEGAAPAKLLDIDDEPTVEEIHQLFHDDSIRFKATAPVTYAEDIRKAYDDYLQAFYARHGEAYYWTQFCNLCQASELRPTTVAYDLYEAKSASK